MFPRLLQLPLLPIRRHATTLTTHTSLTRDALSHLAPAVRLVLHIDPIPPFALALFLPIKQVKLKPLKQSCKATQAQRRRNAESHPYFCAGCPCPTIGGYWIPFRSTVGEQVQRSGEGMASITEGMWLPQPRQVALSVVERERLVNGQEW